MAKKKKKSTIDYDFDTVFGPSEKIEPKSNSKKGSRKKSQKNIDKQGLNDVSFDGLIKDYENKDNIIKIRKLNVKQTKSLVIKSLFVGFLMVIMVMTVILMRFSNHFPFLVNNSAATLIYNSMNLGSILICIAIYLSAVKSSYIKALTRNNNLDLTVVLPAIVSAVQAGISFIDINRFGENKNSFSLFATISIIAIFFSLLGKLYISLRVRDNFKFISSANQKYLAHILDDGDFSTKLARILQTKKVSVAYQRESSVMDDFFDLSVESVPGEKIFSILTPILLICSFIVSIIVLVLTKDIFNCLTTFSLMSCMSIPMTYIVSINKSIYKFCKILLEKKSMISGFSSIKNFSKSDTILLTENDLYPEGSVNLIGLKTFCALRLDESILCAAAVISQTGMSMKSIFDSLIKEKGTRMPEVSGTRFIDSKGIVSWAKGKRILIGNRELLQMHGILPPEKEFEDNHRKKGHKVTYFAKGGELIAAFILSYKPDAKIISEFKRLESDGINIIVKSLDPNITEGLIAHQFDFFLKNIKIINSDEILDQYSKNITKCQNSSSAYIASNGNAGAFARAISGCIRIQATLTLNVALQLISVVIGFVTIMLIAIYAKGVSSIGSFEIIIYTLFWGFINLVSTKISKP